MKYETLNLIAQLLKEEKNRARIELGERNKQAVEDRAKGISFAPFDCGSDRLNKATDALNDFMTTDFR